MHTTSASAATTALLKSGALINQFKNIVILPVLILSISAMYYMREKEIKSDVNFLFCS
jgi:hypothetical protein